MDPIPDELWALTTWEGVRREYLRRSLALTVRERLKALDDMAEVVSHFAWMRRTGKFRSPAGGDAS